MPVCPAGHDSSTGDYCDTCGVPMSGTSAVPGVPVPRPSQAEPAALEPCPVCGAARAGRFCEECGYDFTLRTGGSAPTVPDVAETGDAQWVATVAADRDYFEAVTDSDDGIAFPPYCPERRFPLHGAEVRIGRRSTATGERPELDLSLPPQDPAISHLHAVLLAAPDGGWQLVDPGSTNGTMINDDDKPIAVNVAIPLRDGDRIHIGAWTTITVRRQS
jgi:FHA domain